MAAKRLKDRLTAYLRTHVPKNDQIVSSSEASEHLKNAYNEYARKEMRGFERQVKDTLDVMFSEVNTTNLRKSFYKKKDLLQGQSDFNADAVEEDDGVKESVYDSHGEELVVHTSKNTMNEMILANSKQAGAATLGKRPRSDGQETDGPDSMPSKRKKKQPGSYGAFLGGKDMSAKAEELLNNFRVEPGHTFADVGGMDDTIKQLREMIEWPLKYEGIFEWLGVKPPRGILISGPPGTGKTMLAMAIAGENPELPFYKLNAPEIVSSLSGQSEEKIRQVFLGVREKAPAVVFIDELDSIAGKRESANKDMEVRIVA